MRDSVDTIMNKRGFVTLWCLLLVSKTWLAWQLPLFVDEAFYWQESQHLAWAYSDLPGLTAWLAWLGVSLAGPHALALRAPFLLLGAAMPWLVVRLSAREYGSRVGWQAGTWALLLPLFGSMGLLALPDVPLLFATLLCLDAGLRLLRGVSIWAAAELALGLMLGGMTHYRFVAVIAVGFLALLLLREGRYALRHPWFWLAVALGALAWLPLLLWNFQHADAGLRFQLVERHPWRFSHEGWVLGVLQLLSVTPVLLVGLIVTAWRGWREPQPAARYLAYCGSMLVSGFLLLGFFSDRERVSFHWSLPGFVALLPLLPITMHHWKSHWRWLAASTAGLGLLAVLAYYSVAAVPNWRQSMAGSKWHPTNFTGWDVLSGQVAQQLSRMPAGTQLVAGDFKVGAELGFLLQQPQIRVLDHPLNHHHGRAAQLAIWGLQSEETITSPALLVVAAHHVEFSQLLNYYHGLCQQFDALTLLDVVNADHGRQRFVLFAANGQPRTDGAALPSCVLPSLAYWDAPVANAKLSGTFEVRGWAFKDGVGLEKAEVLLDGAPLVMTDYGKPAPHIAEYWKISTDPQHPHVGFVAQLPALPSGIHWLGLRLYGHDGSVEDWREQRIVVP